jgi:hypothetical protein
MSDGHLKQPITTKSIKMQKPKHSIDPQNDPFTMWKLEEGRAPCSTLARDMHTKWLKFWSLCTCLWSTKKSPCLLTWGLQINFNKSMSFQKLNLWLMRADCLECPMESFFLAHSWGRAFHRLSTFFQGHLKISSHMAFLPAKRQENKSETGAACPSPFTHPNSFSRHCIPQILLRDKRNKTWVLFGQCSGIPSTRNQRSFQKHHYFFL